MSATHDSRGELRWNEAFDAARAFVRLRYEEDGCVVSIGEVLTHLDECFVAADGFTGDVTAVLNLCAALWDDPHIDQVRGGWIEFCWNQAGHWPREDGRGLFALLRDDREEPR